MFQDAGFLKALKNRVRETEAAVREQRIRERCTLTDLSQGNKNNSRNIVTIHILPSYMQSLTR